MSPQLPTGDASSDALHFVIGHVLDSATLAAYRDSYGPFWIGQVLTQRGLAIGEGGKLQRDPNLHRVLRAPIRNVVH